MPLVIGGDELRDARQVRESIDPSRPKNVVARYRQATEADIDRAVATARDDADGWRRRPQPERVAILHSVAAELSAARGELIGAMLAEGGKTLAESDPEVSEAIDFCRFYADSAIFYELISRKTDNPVRPSKKDGQIVRLRRSYARGRGVVVVVSPWNFPLAIPCGGIAAALAAGNNVILKPASDTVLIAYELCEVFLEGRRAENRLAIRPLQRRLGRRSSWSRTRASTWSSSPAAHQRPPKCCATSRR